MRYRNSPARFALLSRAGRSSTIEAYFGMTAHAESVWQDKTTNFSLRPIMRQSFAFGRFLCFARFRWCDALHTCRGPSANEYQWLARSILPTWPNILYTNPGNPTPHGLGHSILAFVVFGVHSHLTGERRELPGVATAAAGPDSESGSAIHEASG